MEKRHIVIGLIGVFSVLAPIEIRTATGPSLKPASQEASDSREEAVQAMRRTANAIKRCPEVLQFNDECMLHYVGPPLNVEWNVLSGPTARAPFQGVIEFTLPQRWKDVEPAKQSKKVHQKCIALEALAGSVKLQVKQGHYRYEFDLGPDPPELMKMLWVIDETKETVATRPDSRFCWSNEARLVEIARERVK